MAPGRKASVRKGKQAPATTPPATPRSARQPRRRSASPPGQPTPLIIRDEPPARSTRSRVSAAPISDVKKPTAEQREPIDCPFIRCRAAGEHQHLPQLQYYRPQADRAVQLPRVRATLRTPTQDEDTSPEAPDVAQDEELAEQEQKEEEQEEEEEREEEEEQQIDVEDNEDDTQDSLIGETEQEPVTEEQEIGADDDKDETRDSLIGEMEQEQEVEGQEFAAVDNEDGMRDLLLGERERSDTDGEPFWEEMSEDEEDYPMLIEPTINDNMHNDAESSLRQTLMTPPPSSPLAFHETPSHISQNPPAQHEEQQYSPSPAPPPQIQPQPTTNNNHTTPQPQAPPSIPPTQHWHIHTLDELIRPLVDPTLAPAPAMAEITATLSTYRSPRDPSYRPEVAPDWQVPSSMMDGDVDMDMDMEGFLMRGNIRDMVDIRDMGVEGQRYFDVGVWEDGERREWERMMEMEGEGEGEEEGEE